MRSPNRRRAFSLTDIVVVLVLVALLIALWLPTIAKTRERARRRTCADHLRMIGQALANYHAQEKSFPRTTYVPGVKPDLSSAGADAPDPFKPGGPPPNNVPAALFLLVRTQDLSPYFTLCPGGNFSPDLTADVDPSVRSNFTDVRRSMGYSFAFPYIANEHWTLNGSLFPIAADLNPGTAGPGDNALIPPTAPPDQLRQANSNNHAKAGQWVLFADGHIEWSTTPFAGLNADNIYSTDKNTVVDTPASGNDTILLPTDD